MDIRTLYMVVGIVYLAVPFTLYIAIRKTSDRQTLLWNMAWMSMGAGALLVGLRDTVPDWMSFLLAHIGFALAYLFRAAVLMVEVEKTSSQIQKQMMRRYVPVAAAYLTTFYLILAFDVDPALRMVFVNGAHVFFFFEFAVQAFSVSRSTNRSGALLVAVMGLMIGIGFLIRVLSVLYDISGRQDTFYPSIDQSIILLLALIGFVIGHFGFFQLRVERLAVQKQRVTDRLIDAEQINQRLQKVLEERNQHLKRVSVMSNASGLGMLAGSLTHELSQPLTSIRLNLSFVERSLGDSPQLAAARDALTEVTQESERLYGVVSRLRGLFQKGSSEHEPVALSDVAAAVTSIVENYCRDAQIRLHVELDPTVHVMGDSVQLQTLVLNLVSNAIEAIRDTHNAGNIWLSITRASNTAVCSVRDDGPGFPENFDFKNPQPFFSSKASGSGVGLWLCRLIAESHGGEISWVQKSAPSGAIINVSLPIIPHESSGTTVAQNRQSQPAVEP